MKPQQQGFILNRSSTSRESESASDWGWWEQMIAQASQQNKNHREKYITTDERTLLERQSSVVRAQYDIAKHELLSNSSISVIQNFDMKIRNSGKHHSEKPRIIQGNLTLMNAPDKGGSKMLNECCSYCNLTTAHVNELTKGQRHRLGVAHNILERTGRVELSSRTSAIPRNKVDKRKHERAERLKAKPVHSDTMTSSLTGELQNLTIKLSPEKARLIKESTIIDKTMFKSKKIIQKYQQNAEQTKLPLRQDNLEHTAIGLVPLPHNLLLSEREINNSNYDSWYKWRQGHQEKNKLISLEKIAQQPKFQQKTGTPSERSTKFLQLQDFSRSPDITRKYRETVQKPSRRKGKPRCSERKEITETRRCLELNQAKSVDSAENSTLRQEYTNYNKNNVLRQATEIKSSLALNVECNKNNNFLFWKESQTKETQKKEHVLKRCSCELKLYSNQSESESMIINILNPTKENADSELLSSLFKSNDFVVKCDRREGISTITDLNDFTSISVMKAISKEAKTCLNVKEDEYISASSNLLVKPAIANLHEVCDKSMIRLKLEVASGKSYQNQKPVHLSDRSTNANDNVKQKILYINDSQSTIRNVCREHRENIFANNTSPSMINISSLSLLHSQQARKLPRMEGSIDTDISTSRNLFSFKNMSAVSFILSSVTITDNIRPAVCRRNRVIIPTSSDISEYLEIPKTHRITDSVLKSSSKISLFQSDSIPYFFGIRRPNELLIKNSLNSASNTSTCCLDQTNDAFVYLDSQSVLSISRCQLSGNIEIAQSKAKQERIYEMQTLRQSPGKNDLDKHAPRSQFSQSFCTMNVRIPVQDLTSSKHVRDKIKHVKEEPRLSVLYQKDISTRQKSRIKTDLLMKNISRFSQRTVPKERSIKPSKYQKRMSSNKKVKFQKNERACVSKCTTLEKSFVPKGQINRYKQESLPKLVRRDQIKSSGKQLFPYCLPISSQKLAQIGTNLNINTDFFKDVNSWPTSYPITSGSNDLNFSQRKEPNVNNKNEIRVPPSNKMSHQNDGVIGKEKEIAFPVKISHVKSQTRFRLHKNNLNIDDSLPKFKSETGTNKGWKSVINKCVKTIKSVTTKKAAIAVNTNMSAAHCYSKCKQWEQSCYFCTVSRETPEKNQLSTRSKRISNVDCNEFIDEDNFLKRCSGTMNFFKNSKVQDTSAKKKTYNQKLDSGISPQFTGQAKIIYQNPASYIYRTCDSYECAKQSSKKHKTLGTETENNNMSTVSTITPLDRPLYKSKSIQFNEISKRQRKVPRIPKSYEIETIFPLECTKFHKSKSEIILLQNNDIKCRNTDESNIPNSGQGIQLYSVSNKSRPLKKKKELNVNKVKPVVSKGNEHALKSSLSSPTNFKRFIIRCMTLFRRNIRTHAKVKVTDVKSKVNEFDCKHFHTEAKPSFKSLKLHHKHIKVQGDDLKKSKSDRRRKESDCISRSEKNKSLKMTKERRNGKLDKKYLKECTQTNENNLGDANSLTSKVSSYRQSKNGSQLSSHYKQEKIYCGYAQIHSKREPLHKLALPRLLNLNDKSQPQKSMNFKKTNCQVMKKDVGTNCNRKKRFKNKTKWVQAELWDEKTVLMMSEDRKNNCTPQCKTSDRMMSARNKCEPKETKQKKCGRITFGIKKNEAKDNYTSSLTKECVAKNPNDKNETKISHSLTAKCKKFWKVNKPHNEQAFEETYPCYGYVDCKAKCKEKKNKIKRLDIDNASKVKCTQTPPKVKKAKYTKAAAKTAVKALQVDSVKLLKVVGKVNQIKFAVKPKELTTLPFKNNGKRNEATNCDKAKQKNKYVKTVAANPFICSKSTSTGDLIEAKMPVKEKLAIKTAKVEKAVLCPSSVNRENDISTYIKTEMKTGVGRAVKLKHQKNTASALEALLLQEPAKNNDVDFYPWCTSTSPTKKIGSRIAKQKKEKTKIKTKKGISSHKHLKTRDYDVFSVSTTSTPKKLAVNTFAKQKQKKKNAKTKKALLLNKAVMTQDILVSSCCTNTTPSIDKKNCTKVFAKHKQERNPAICKKALPPNKVVETKGVCVSSRSTNTTTSCDKKVEAKIYVKKKRDDSTPNTKRALSCPRYPQTSITKVNRAGFSVNAKKEKTASRRKQLHSDSNNNKYGKPFIKGTQTKNKCKAKQINEERIANNYKGRTKIYTTEDKQTSASSKCMPPLKTELPVKYPTVMSANRTKQICCAFFTAGAWHNSRAAISRNSQACATYKDKPLHKNLQIMTTHGITCNMEKQRNSRQSKYVNAVTKEKDKELKQDLKIPLSKSSPCCICGNAICEKCKVNLFNKSFERGRKGENSIKLKNKGEGDSKKNNFKCNTKRSSLQNISVKVARKKTKKTTQQKNKSLAKDAKKMEKLNTVKGLRSVKEAREMEKLNKQKDKFAAKRAKEMEKINKREYKYLAKEAKKMEKVKKRKSKSIPKEKKKGKIVKIKYQSVKKDQPQRKGVKTKRKDRSVVKQTIRSKKSINDPRVKTLRIPFAFLTCSRTQKRDSTDAECKLLYKTTFRRRMVLFIYVRSCCYFVRTMFRRLLGCLFFSLGVIVWTPCICCFECCRECLFCCCSSYR